MDIALYAVYIIGFLVVIKLISYGLAVKALLGIRFKKGDCVLHDLCDVPSYLKDLFSMVAEQERYYTY